MRPWAVVLAVWACAPASWAQNAPQREPPELVAPLVEHHHEAIYPAAELAAKKHADVVLFVTIDAQGHVTDMQVAQSGGKPFDDAAMSAMRDWTFVPAQRNGRSVAARIRVPFHFSPPEEPAANEIMVPGMRGQVVQPGSRAADAQGAHTHGIHGVHGHAPPQPVEVRVGGRSQMPSRGAGDHDIVVGRLATVPRMDSASLLRLAPGVLLTNSGGLGHPHQIFLRGFDAREGQDIEFTVDGIPINEVGNPHGSGVADTHFIIPELVSRLRVVEGPFAPQQGNFAVAGSALYDLGLDRTGLTSQVRLGSFGTKRLLLLWRPQGSSDRTFGGAELFASGGFGQNRSAERATAMAGYEGNLGDSGSYRILVSSYASHYAQAGVLRVDDVEGGRKGFYDTYDPSQGGDSTRHALGATINGRAGGAKLTQSTFVVLRDFRLRQNFTGYQGDPQQTWQTVHARRGDLIDQRSEQITFGGRGSARQTAMFFGQKQELELGYFGRYDRADGVQQRNRSGTTIPYRTDLDLASGLVNVGAYADASVYLLPWFNVRGGLRGDLYHYRVTNRCALTSQSSFGGDPLDTECFSSDRLGYRHPTQTVSTAASIWQPRATLLVGPFQGFTFSLSRGLGSRSIDPQYVNQDLKTPFAAVTATEGGVAYLQALGSIDLNVRSVFFQTSVDKDLFFNQSEGRNTLASGTTRTGWAGNVRATGTFFDIAASLTLVRATFDDTRLVIPYAPNVVARGDGVVFGGLPFRVDGKQIEASLGAGASFVGARPLPFNERSEALFLVDAGASLKWRSIALGIIATNLFDRRYRLGEYNYASDFRSQPYPTQVAARHFTAGEPRALYATVALTFDGEGGHP